MAAHNFLKPKLCHQGKINKRKKYFTEFQSRLGVERLFPCTFAKGHLSGLETVRKVFALFYTLKCFLKLSQLSRAILPNGCAVTSAVSLNLAPLHYVTVNIGYLQTHFLTVFVTRAPLSLLGRLRLNVTGARMFSNKSPELYNT